MDAAAPLIKGHIMAFGKGKRTEREEAAYLAGMHDAQVLFNLWMGGRGISQPCIRTGDSPECPARFIERFGAEHDRYAPLPDNCVAVYRGGNITCLMNYEPID